MVGSGDLQLSDRGGVQARHRARGLSKETELARQPPHGRQQLGAVRIPVQQAPQGSASVQLPAVRIHDQQRFRELVQGRGKAHAPGLQGVRRVHTGLEGGQEKGEQLQPVALTEGIVPGARMGDPQPRVPQRQRGRQGGSVGYSGGL